MTFTQTQLDYLASQQLGRLATVHPATGMPQNSPVSFSYNPTTGTVDIVGGPVLHFVGDHDASPFERWITTMPLRLVSRSFWKNSANDTPDRVSTTFGNSSPPKRTFCACRWLDRSNSTESSASRSTSSVSQQASKSPGSSLASMHRPGSGVVVTGARVGCAAVVGRRVGFGAR